MPVRLIKFSVYLCCLLFAAKSIGYTNTYRFSPSISQKDFSSIQLERWQNRSKNIVSIEHGRWYLNFLGGNTRVIYRDFKNVEQTILFDTVGLKWNDCQGNISFDVKNTQLESNMDTACIDKKTFQQNVSTLIVTSKQMVKNHQMKALADFEAQENNKRSWINSEPAYL